MTRGGSDIARIRAVASTPSRWGIRTSIRTTSGRSRAVWSIASRPSVASPTTVKSSTPSRMVRRREFRLGMSDGPDVRQLETNLVALGYGTAVTVDDHFSPATATAISHWQAALGVPRTGALALADVLFAPGPARVSQALATLGSRIGSDQNVLGATSTARVVTVDLPTVAQATVSVGANVVVTPPTGGPQPGTVTSVGRVAQTAQQGPQGG